MSVINSPVGLMGGGGYNIPYSLRFNDDDSAYLSRTFAVGNRKTWTLSLWIKRAAITNAYQAIFAPSNAGHEGLALQDDDKITFFTGNATTSHLRSNVVFRDPSAWYHLVLAWDTTQGTASDRIKVWVNGSQVTDWAIANYPTLNLETPFNNNVAHYISTYDGGSNWKLDALLAEVNFIGGQALTPSAFGKADPETGVWVAKKYTGSYGTNGFYLDFRDATSATTLGNDKSGNGNNWTPSGIGTEDQLTDTPTSNHCVFNRLVGTTSNTYSDGNLQLQTSTSSAIYSHQRATFAVSRGKWYWEVKWHATSATPAFGMMGIVADTVTVEGQYVGQGDSYAYRSDTGDKINNGTTAAYGATFAVGDIIGLALDLDAGTLTFYKNGVSQGQAFTGIAGEYFPAVADLDNNSGRWSTFIANFGQRPFTYTPPAGFKALNSKNLAVPSIKKPARYFDVKTRNGDSSGTQTVTGLAFSPDFVWTKSRSNAFSHVIADTLRGATKNLVANSPGAESTNNVDGYLSSFTSDGYVFTNGSTSGNLVKGNGFTYVDWALKEGAIPGFDIITYSGDGSGTRNVGHALGAAPALVIIKSRNTGATSWHVWHKSLTAATNYLFLDVTDAEATDSTRFNSAPTSSNIVLGSASAVNGVGATFVAYAFAQVPGFSHFGKYTGNGTADAGPFVWCGFRPRFVMVKRIDAVEDWNIIDSARSQSNEADHVLFPNLSNVEYTVSDRSRDLLSNGFKLRDTDPEVNANGGTYIYAAFAESPFKYANAR